MSKDVVTINNFKLQIMNLLKRTAVLLLMSAIVFLQSCSGCDNENPTAKVSNLGTDEVSIQVKTTGGNTENLNNIAPNGTSATTSYAPGEITYTIVLKGGEELVEVVTLDYCEDYTITVNSDNTDRKSVV